MTNLRRRFQYHHRGYIRGRSLGICVIKYGVSSVYSYWVILRSLVGAQYFNCSKCSEFLFLNTKLRVGFGEIMQNFVSFEGHYVA